MAIQSLWIFGRHCEPIFYHDRTGKNVNPGDRLLPGVISRSAYSTAAQPAPLAGGSGTAIAVAQPNDDARAVRGLSIEEEAKLVYGVIFSVRNMVRKLAGRDETFLSFSTSAYKLHYFETPTSIRFVALADTSPSHLRSLLKQIYAGPYLDHVVRNPAVRSLDSTQRGRGIDSQAFRSSVEAYCRS